MSGITTSEQAVLARFEGGASIREIADEFEITPQSVVWIVRTFGVDPVLDQHREAAIRRGSRELLARIRKAGGHR